MPDTKLRAIFSFQGSLYDQCCLNTHSTFVLLCDETSQKKIRYLKTYSITVFFQPNKEFTMSVLRKVRFHNMVGIKRSLVIFYRPYESISGSSTLFYFTVHCNLQILISVMKATVPLSIVYVV